MEFNTEKPQKLGPIAKPVARDLCTPVSVHPIHTDGRYKSEINTTAATCKHLTVLIYVVTVDDVIFLHRKLLTRNVIKM